MHGKSQVINPHSRLFGLRMPGCILSADHRRIEKGDSVYSVADEAQDIDGGEVDG